MPDAFDQLYTLPFTEPRSVIKACFRQMGWRIRAYCDCGGQWSCYGGTIGRGDDNRMLHHCSSCGAQSVFHKSYPETVIEKEEPGMSFVPLAGGVQAPLPTHTDDDIAFELLFEDRRVRIYFDGRADGLPEGTVLINRLHHHLCWLHERLAALGQALDNRLLRTGLGGTPPAGPQTD